MRNLTIFWSCWASSDLLSSYEVSELHRTHVIPVNHNGRITQTGIATKSGRELYSITEKEQTNPKNVWKDKPFPLQFSFNRTAGPTTDIQPPYEGWIPQHSLVIAFPFCIEGCDQVSLRRPWPVMTSFTTCSAPFIVPTMHMAPKVTTQTQTNGCHTVDPWTFILWHTIRTVMICGQKEIMLSINHLFGYNEQ